MPSVNHQSELKKSVKWISAGVLWLMTVPSVVQAQCVLQRRADLTGGGIGPQVTAVVSFDDGTGPAVFASAFPATNAIYRRTANSGWTATTYGPGAVGASVRAMYVDEDPVNGPTLLAAAGGQLLKWSGADQRWETLGPPAPWSIWAIARHTDASGSYLVTVSTSGTSVNGVAQRLTASGWERLGVNNAWMQGQAVVSADLDGDGPGAPSLFVVGRSGFDGQTGSADVMRWDGTSWLALPRLSGWSKSAVVFDDGTGVGVYVSSHVTPTFMPFTSVAKWNGQAWVAIDNRVQNPLRNDDVVYGMTLFDDGTGHGTELYGVTTSSVVRLRNGEFTRLASQTNSVVTLGYQQLAMSAGSWANGAAEALWVPRGSRVDGYFGCPRCAGDFDQNGEATSNDVFAYLAAWFGARAEADTNQSGGTPTLQDLFDFLSGWFVGCA